MLKKLWEQFYISANLITFTQISFRLIIVLYASSLLTDAKAIGSMMIFDTLPFLILGPVIAKIVNRHNRKSLLKLTVLLDLMLTLAFLVIMGTGYHHLLVFALLLGLNNVVTSTYQIAESSPIQLRIRKIILRKNSKFQGSYTNKKLPCQMRFMWSILMAISERAPKVKYPMLALSGKKYYHLSTQTFERKLNG